MVPIFLSIISESNSLQCTPITEYLLHLIERVFTKWKYRNLIERGAEEAHAAGLPHWRPKVFHYSDAVPKSQRDFLYSEANNTCPNNRGRFPALCSILAVSESESIEKTEDDPTLMYACARRIKKWQPLDRIKYIWISTTVSDITWLWRNLSSSHWGQYRYFYAIYARRFPSYQHRLVFQSRGAQTVPLEAALQNSQARHQRQ